MSSSITNASVVETWSRGVGFLEDGDLVRASDCFEYVLEYQPYNADAWLGLYACGERRDEALLRMLEHRGYLGQLRGATGLALEPSYGLGQFIERTLDGVFDIWLAYVVGLIEAERFDHAREALATADEQEHERDERIRFLRARRCFEQGDWEQTLVEAEDIEDPLLRDEARLYAAASLEHLDIHYEALDAAEGLPAAIEDPEFDAHVFFVRGKALEALGEGKLAKQAFQRAYRLAPDIEAFAERAGADRPAQSAGAEPDRRISKALFGREQPGGDRAKLLEEAGRQLDALIGLEPVKARVNTLKAQFRMAILRRERGLETSARPQHFVFTGPPGTGKTTVARIMGEILAGLGLLEHGRVVETQRGDLVGRYLGHTAVKTRAKIEEAIGGVLFIDEAYGLANQGYDGEADAFGEEALQEILTAAENRRDELVIILAGYTEEIGELLATNPGLRSRFSTVVEFPTYAVEELAAIAASILSAAGESLSPEAERSLRAGCEAVVESGRIDELGNGRFARELSHKAAAQRDLRLLVHYGDSGAPSTAEMTTIEAVDVANALDEFAA